MEFASFCFYNMFVVFYKQKFAAGLAFSVTGPGCTTWSQELTPDPDSKLCPRPKPQVSLTLTTYKELRSCKLLRSVPEDFFLRMRTFENEFRIEVEEERGGKQEKRKK